MTGRRGSHRLEELRRERVFVQRPLAKHHQPGIGRGKDQRHVGPGHGPLECHIPEAQLPRSGHEVGLLHALADDADPHVARHEVRRLQERADALGEPDGSGVDDREGLVPAELSPGVGGREPAVEAGHVHAVRDVLDPSRCGSLGREEVDEPGAHGRDRGGAAIREVLQPEGEPPLEARLQIPHRDGEVRPRVGDVEDVREPGRPERPRGDAEEERGRLNQGDVVLPGDREAGQRRPGERRMPHHPAGHAGSRDDDGRQSGHRDAVDPLPRGAPARVAAGHEAQGVAGHRRHDGDPEATTPQADDSLPQPRLRRPHLGVVVLGHEQQPEAAGRPALFTLRRPLVARVAPVPDARRTRPTRGSAYPSRSRMPADTSSQGRVGGPALIPSAVESSDIRRCCPACGTACTAIS